MPNNNPTLAPTVAQQVFSISSGVAGGLAGFVLANRLAGVQEVPRNQVIAAALLSGAFTFGAAFLIKAN